MQSKHKIIVIVGPTASGKTALGIELAKQYNGEIISADSRQVYRGLDIGTGKDKSFPQHLIDVADISEEYNVSHFVRDGENAIEDITSRGKLPIIVGGTGFWVDALVFGHELPEVKPNADLRRELEQRTAAELFEILQKQDPFRAKHIDKHNKRRLIRALEIGRTPELQKIPAYDTVWIGIKLDKVALRKRIEQRIDQWLMQGLVEETKKLPNPEKFGFMYSGKSRDEMVKLTMQYAKRQMTWFKRNKEIRWTTSLSEAHQLLRDWLGLSRAP